MSLNHGGKIVTSGLVLMLDEANVKSFPGEPTTNIVPDPTNNGRFTTSNSWSTYNTNMYCDPVGSYGCGVFWYMGTTISSVSNNIVTTTSAHPFRSFDVLRPQTTGGGLTANTDYVVKKISSTQFSLHQYNGSQDGSQGYINPATGFYKVHDAYATDTRIAVNSTNFPTMWFGAPHLPNSGLIKEIVNGGGYVRGTNSMRLHVYRGDGVADGMAYDVYPHVTVGDTITISVYLKATDYNAAGKNLGYSTYFGPSSSASSANFTIGNTGVWNRYTLTWVASATYDFISYWFPQGALVPYSIDMADFQVEIKSHATPFTTGTRGNTVATNGGWKDLSGKGNHADLTNMSYDSTGMLYNGTSSYLTIAGSSDLSFNGDFTIDGWIFPTAHTGTVVSLYLYTDGILFRPWSDVSNDDFYINGVNVGSCSSSYPTNTWTYFAITRIGTNVKLYANLNVILSTTTSGTVNSAAGSLVLGRSIHASSEYFTGKIENIRINKNKGLIPSEILQNYNATKGRYGLT